MFGNTLSAAARKTIELATQHHSIFGSTVSVAARKIIVLSTRFELEDNTMTDLTALVWSPNGPWHALHQHLSQKL
jgi:hypothetical protein